MNEHQEHIIEELARIAFASYGEVVNLESGTIKPGIKPDTAAAIASVGYKQARDQDEKQVDVKLYDKLKALELMGKHYSMFGDKRAGDAPININFADDYGDDEDYNDGCGGDCLNDLAGDVKNTSEADDMLE